MHFTKRMVLAAMLAVSLGAVSAERAGAETTLRYVPSSDLQVLDPIWTTASITKTHAFMIYDTLFGVDEDGNIQPSKTLHRFDDANSQLFFLQDRTLFDMQLVIGTDFEIGGLFMSQIADVSGFGLERHAIS